jgi:NTE family protein
VPPPQKTALVLGGGGARGAVEVGFIERIAELAIPIDFVVGTSVGALNAAHVAFHEPANHHCLRDIWQGMAGQRLVYRSPWRIVRQLGRSRMSISDHGFVASLLRQHLVSDDFASASVPLYVTATNLRTGERRIFSDGSVTQAILASTALPGIFPPVAIEGDLYVDGGVSSNLDIAAAEELGATQVIALDPRPVLPPGNPRNLVEVLARSLEILAEARSVCSTEHRPHKAAVVHIRPGIPGGSAWNFSGTEDVLSASYSQASAILDQCWDGRALRAGHYHPPNPGAAGEGELATR